jgi:alpha-amylase
VAVSACLLAFRRGALGLVAINKCGNSVEFDVDAGGDKLWQLAPYRDVLSGDTLVLSARRQRVVLPARTARMWLRAGRECGGGTRTWPNPR